MIFIPGGFSGGDEPDGSAKFIIAFFRNRGISEAVTELLDRRDGLMCGICNGFQALIKLGLVPYGKILETDEHCPTLTFNTIGRHQSRIVLTRVASNLSPWLRGAEVGEVYSVPISHGEGRFLAEESLIRESPHVWQAPFAVTTAHRSRIQRSWQVPVHSVITSGTYRLRSRMHLP